MGTGTVCYLWNGDRDGNNLCGNRWWWGRVKTGTVWTDFKFVGSDGAGDKCSVDCNATVNEIFWPTWFLQPSMSSANYHTTWHNTHTNSHGLVWVPKRGHVTELPPLGSPFISTLTFILSNEIRINCIIYGQKDHRKRLKCLAFA